MQILVNGWPESIRPDRTLADLIDRFGESDPALIVELNGRFVYPDKYDTTKVREGDKVEFIHAAFGG